MATTNAPAPFELVRENFKTFVRRLGRAVTKPDNDWPPVLLVEDAEGRINTCPLPRQAVESAEEKDYLANVVLPRLVRELDGRRVGLALHCWHVSQLTDPYVDSYIEEHESIAEHPGRSECVTLLVLDEEHCEAWVAQVDRRPGRRPKLGPWSEMGLIPDGRFVGPLRQAVANDESERLEEASAESVHYFHGQGHFVNSLVGADERWPLVLALSREDGSELVDLAALHAECGADVERGRMALREKTHGLRSFGVFAPVVFESGEEYVTLVVGDGDGLTTHLAAVRRAPHPELSEWQDGAGVTERTWLETLARMLRARI